MSELWNSHIRLYEPKADARKRSQKLPPEFRKVVLEGNSTRTVEQLEDKFGLLGPIAQAYCDATPFFLSLRKFRDDIIHLGKDPDNIFITERGFGISTSAFGFGDLPFWKQDHFYNPRVRSLLPLLAHLITSTMVACNELVIAFASALTLPPPIAPGYRIFTRGPHNEALIWMQDVANGASGWFGDRRRWKEDRIRERAYFHWKHRTGKRWEDDLANWEQAKAELSAPRPEPVVRQG